MDSNNSIFKAAVSRGLYLYKYLNNYWHTIVIKGVIIKPLRVIKYVLFDCNSFIKPQRFTNGGLVMRYIKVPNSEKE